MTYNSDLGMTVDIQLKMEKQLIKSTLVFCKNILDACNDDDISKRVCRILDLPLT